jgi:formate hydrogenlyase transcriptional activator
MSIKDYRESSKEEIAHVLDALERYRIILEINNAIISKLNLNDLLQSISVTIKEKLPFDVTAITLYEPVRDVLQLYAFEASYSSYFTTGFQLPRAGSDVGWALDNKKTLIMRDLSREGGFSTDKMLLKEGLRSYIIAPLIIGERAIGSLNIGSKTPNKFQEADADFLSLIAKQIALAIDNARAHEEIEKLKNRLEKENIYLQDEIKTEYNYEEIIGESTALKRVLKDLEKVSKTGSTVLIQVNCPAIPLGLIESELFGHEKGAFTGALSRKIGKFELADGGTIFLDEVADLPLEAQAKLLRVLQEKEFERVGGTKTLKADVRVIAATNSDLEAAVKEGRFRTDLFYRLNVFPICLPPLRERKQDIPLLVKYFAKKYISSLGKDIKSIDENKIDRLKEYSWPGNIRELENIVERAVILSTGDMLEINENLIGSLSLFDMISHEKDNLFSLEDIEREHIIKVLNQTDWQINGEKGAAKILGINPNTLRARMTKLGIKIKRQLQAG